MQPTTQISHLTSGYPVPLSQGNQQRHQRNTRVPTYPGIPTHYDVKGNHGNENNVLQEVQKSEITLETIRNILWPNALKFINDIYNELSKNPTEEEEAMVQSLLTRNVKQIRLHRYPKDQIVKEEDLAKAVMLAEDADVYDDTTGQCILRLRKNVVDPQMIKKLAARALMCLPRPNEIDLDRKGVANISNSTFDPTKPHIITYRKGWIRGKKTADIYEVELEASKLSKDGTKKNREKLKSFPSGKLGKIPQKLECEMKDLIDTAKYSADFTFEPDEEVIVPFEEYRFGVYGIAPPANGHPVRITRHSIELLNNTRLFARSLYGVQLCDLFFRAVDPKGYNNQHGAAQLGPHLNDWAFSTFDININTASSYHVDHNSHEGEQTQLMTALFKVEECTRNNFLIMPEYNLAVVATNGDFILFNAELRHGNPFLKVDPPSAEYFRRMDKTKKEDWGTWGRELNPNSYACSFIAYLRDSLQGKTFPNEGLIQEPLQNPFGDIRLMNDARLFNITLPRNNVFPVPNLPWITAIDSSIRLTRRIEIKPSFQGMLPMQKDQLLKLIKNGLYLRPQNKAGLEASKGRLDSTRLQIMLDPTIQIVYWQNDREPRVVLDLELSIKLSVKVTSEKYKSLFNLELFGTPLWTDIFVQHSEKYLTNKLNGEYSTKTLSKPWLKTAWWWTEIMEHLTKPQQPIELEMGIEGGSESELPDYNRIPDAETDDDETLTHPIPSVPPTMDVEEIVNAAQLEKENAIPMDIDETNPDNMLKRKLTWKDESFKYRQAGEFKEKVMDFNR